MQSSATHLKFALGVLLVFAAVSTRQEQIIGLLVFGGPFMAALLLPIRHTRYAIGLSVGALIIELPVCLFFSFVGGIFSTSHDVSPIHVLTALLCYVAIACRMAYRDSKVPEGRERVLGMAVLSFMFIAGSASIASAHSRQNTSIRCPAGVMGPINACAHEFAEKHGGQFPAKLSELSAQGTGCLDSDFAKNHGVKIQYKATASSDGEPHYSVLIRQGGWFNFNAESYYSDDSGIVHEYTMKHAADDTTVVLPNPALTIHAIADCLIQSTGEGTYPRSFDEFPDQAFLPARVVNRACSKENIDGALKYNAFRTKITYKPKSSPNGFLLEARPEIYGQQGIRSYVVDERGIIHATPENRQARLEDPVVPRCEYTGYEPCAQ